MIEKAKQAIAEYEALESQLSDPAVYNDLKKSQKLAQERRAMESRFLAAKNFLQYWNQKKDAEEILENETDEEFLEMAKTELDAAKANLKTAEETLKLACIPQDPNDEKPCLVEIRAGVGGDESSLFAEEISRAILRFSENSKWKTELISESPNEAGGMKEIIFRVGGEGAYGKLKFESGVHRVQRIPVTETQGRVHTSVVSIVVMPEVEESEIAIDPNDLRIDVFRSSGAGGQSVNTTDSAVRITHLPTGIVVSCQNERSQQQNKDRALQVLFSRLQAAEEEKRMQELGEKRLASIGSGDRVDKIRTYNFPQDRITDHRIGQNFSNISGVMEGNLEKIIEALQLEEQKIKLGTETR